GESSDRAGSGSPLPAPAGSGSSPPTPARGRGGSTIRRSFLAAPARPATTRPAPAPASARRLGRLRRRLVAPLRSRLVVSARSVSSCRLGPFRRRLVVPGSPRRLFWSPGGLGGQRGTTLRRGRPVRRASRLALTRSEARWGRL